MFLAVSRVFLRHWFFSRIYNIPLRAPAARAARRQKPRRRRGRGGGFGEKIDESGMSRQTFLRVASYRLHQNKDTCMRLSMLQRSPRRSDVAYTWNHVSPKPSFWAGNKNRSSYQRKDRGHFWIFLESGGAIQNKGCEIFDELEKIILTKNLTAHILDRPPGLQKSPKMARSPG